MNLFRPLFLLVLFFLFGCSSSHDYVYLAGQVTCQTAQELQEDRELYLCGKGGAMMDDIKLMSLHLEYFENVNVKNARNLIIFATQTYLNNINNDRSLRPYLHTYPFTLDNIEVVIYFSPEPPLSSSEDALALVSLRRGIIEYKIEIPEQIPSLHSIAKETYEEALKKLDSSP